MAPIVERDPVTEVMSRRDCLDILAGSAVGRVAVSAGAFPELHLARIALVGDDLVFPAVLGGKFEAAVRDRMVAVEVDRSGPRGGMSVVAAGVAAEDGDFAAVHPEVVQRLAPDAPRTALTWFRVRIRSVSGRRIPRPPLHVGGSVPAGLATDAGPADDEPAGGETTAVVAPPAGGAETPLPVEECVERLATEDVGRLVVVLAGTPLVFPLNYALDGDAIVFRTGVGTKLHAIDRSLVAFEADRAATADQPGWTVTVQGWAQEITSADAPGLRERLAALPVHPLVGHDRDHFVRIAPCSITGHLIPARAVPARERGTACSS